MRLSPPALAAASAVLWGGSILFVDVMNQTYPDYGEEFLDVTRSVYPGFKKTKGPERMLVGAAYAALDGAICGFLFAHIYNALARK